MSRRGRFALKMAAGFTLAAVVAAVLFVLVLQSPWFHDAVRARILREIEKATGGRAEIASFFLQWRDMRAEVRGLVVHGLETAGEPPLMRAESVGVGLKIVSAFRRKVDIALLEIRAPEVNVTVDAAGRTNIPAPRVARQGSRQAIEQLLDLSIGSLRLHHGKFTYRDRKMPLELSGEQVHTRLTYEPAGPAYRGHIQARSLRMAEPLRVPLAFDAAMDLRVDRDALQLDNIEMNGANSVLRGKARIDRFDDPRLEAALDGTGEMRGIVPAFRLPVRPEGSARFAGKLTWSREERWAVTGTVAARGIGADIAGVQLRDISADTPVRASPARLEAADLRAGMLGGNFSGRLTLIEWDRFDVAGNASGFVLDRLKQLAAKQLSTLDRFAYSGKVSGPVRASGSLRSMNELRAGAELTIEAGEGALPLSGTVAFDYDHRANRLVFQNSHLVFPSSRVSFNGSIEQGVEVGLFSRDLNDFLPAIPMFSEQAPASLPVRLERGIATFQGRLGGSLEQPTIAGRLDAEAFSIQGRLVDRASANLEVSAGRLRISRIAAEQQTLRMDGSATIDLDRWRVMDASAVTAQISVRQARLEHLVAEGRLQWPMRGALSGFIDVRGTVAWPRASGAFTITDATLWEETFDRVNLEVRLTPETLEVPVLRALKGQAVMDATGSYERRGNDWNTGDARFQVTARDMKLTPWALAARYRPDLDASVAGKMTGAARVEAGRVELTSLDGDMRLDNVMFRGRPVGAASVTARTSSRLVSAQLAAKFGDAEVTGRAEWSLPAGSYGLGQLQTSNITFATLHSLGLFGDPNRELPFRGSVDGEVGFSGPILHPENWTGTAKIRTLQIEPVPSGPLRPEDVKRLALRNSGPMNAYLDARGLHLQQARLVGEGTDLEALGTVGFRGRGAWNLQLRGSVNLPVLAIVEPDLLATGKSTVDATIRGTLANPQVTGQMEIAGATFNVRDVPNGLERTNAVIRFDRTRATIEKFTAQTGGGDLSLTGFVGFGGDEFVYRLQAAAQRVRVRYPTEVSTTFNAALSLTGTSSRRMLSGGVTVTRIGITPKTDIGSLLVETGRSVTPTPTSNPFLRGMQLDIHIETSPDAELQTSLTRDIQPEADLRLRGSANRPAVLGRVSVNQGEIQFFGTQYTITRGDISFFNPVKIEPVLNLDLETRVRGITVTINFTGPMDKLNVSYRSDPPLQSTEIVALLTVGRAPGLTPTTGAASSANPSQSLFSAGGNSLLGQAVAAPITGRLQRLFGVSRLKIDPELTGVTNIPQARVTVEQQLSREVTITYIFNLNRTQQQIVRLQWDFSRVFSLLAVRDENGIFGVDFLYRKRFR